MCARVCVCFKKGRQLRRLIAVIDVVVVVFE